MKIVFIILAVLLASCVESHENCIEVGLDCFVRYEADKGHDLYKLASEFEKISEIKIVNSYNLVPYIDGEISEKVKADSYSISKKAEKLDVWQLIKYEASNGDRLMLMQLYLGGTKEGRPVTEAYISNGVLYENANPCPENLENFRGRCTYLFKSGWSLNFKRENA